jgi:hypothetical protein
MEGVAPTGVQLASIPVSESLPTSSAMVLPFVPQPHPFVPPAGPSTIPHVPLPIPVAPSLSVTTSTPTVAAPAISTTLVDHMNVLHTLRNRRLAYSRDSFVTFSEGLLEAPGLEDDLWCDEYTGLKR